MAMRTLYHKKKIHARAAALILAGGVLLGGSVLGGRGHLISLAADTASQLPLKGEAIGVLVIPGRAREEKPVRIHDKRTTVKAPERVEVVEEEQATEAAPEEDERVEIEDSTQGEDSAKSQLMTEPEPILRYLGEYKITGYDTCARCCGNTRGITASGTTATVGRTCAAPKDLPFGTRLWIEGIGERIVEDRGGAVHGKKIDVLCADHPACYAITGTYEVYIIEEAEG